MTRRPAEEVGWAAVAVHWLTALPTIAPHFSPSCAILRHFRLSTAALHTVALPEQSSLYPVVSNQTGVQSLFTGYRRHNSNPLRQWEYGEESPTQHVLLQLLWPLCCVGEFLFDKWLTRPLWSWMIINSSGCHQNLNFYTGRPPAHHQESNFYTNGHLPVVSIQWVLDNVQEGSQYFCFEH